MPANSPWAIAIFAARETPAVLASSVRAAIAASAGRGATIDVLVNGNQELATNFAHMAATIEAGDCILRVWSIAAPDKAHTWNEYVHRIWDTGTTAFFIDGYAKVKPDSLALIERRLAADPDAWAATGVPTSGRSAGKLREQMLREGGMHGNLYAITGDSMRAIRQVGFRLPLGLYRNDSLIGAALVYRLDPGNNEWKIGRIAVEGGATWDIDGISQLTIKNIIGQFRRRLRQAQGDLENRAVREHMAIKGLAPQFLPATTQEMVSHWISTNPDQARALFRKRPLCRYAARQMRAQRDWAATKIAPSLLLTHSNSSQANSAPVQAA